MPTPKPTPTPFDPDTIGNQGKKPPKSTPTPTPDDNAGMPAAKKIKKNSPVKKVEKAITSSGDLIKAGLKKFL